MTKLARLILVIVSDPKKYYASFDLIISCHYYYYIFIAVLFNFLIIFLTFYFISIIIKPSYLNLNSLNLHYYDYLIHLNYYYN